MAEPSTSPTAVKANQMFVSGRIDHVSKFNDTFDHIVITPAPDAYSKPALLRVSARRKLGQEGDELRVLASFNGWANNYKNKNNDEVKDVRGFFVVVE